MVITVIFFSGCRQPDIIGFLLRLDSFGDCFLCCFRLNLLFWDSLYSWGSSTVCIAYNGRCCWGYEILTVLVYYSTICQTLVKQGCVCGGKWRVRCYDLVISVRVVRGERSGRVDADAVCVEQEPKVVDLNP